MSNNRLVYSTETGRICPKCSRPESQCACKKQPSSKTAPGVPADGTVRIRRESQGRKGKTVSIIHGLALDGSALDDMARVLKQRCGSGGTVKDGTIIIQGDHRERLRETLAEQGYTVKLAGG